MEIMDKDDEMRKSQKDINEKETNQEEEYVVNEE